MSYLCDTVGQRYPSLCLEISYLWAQDDGWTTRGRRRRRGESDGDGDGDGNDNGDGNGNGNGNADGNGRTRKAYRPART
jgi:hypothetical protein